MQENKLERLAELRKQKAVLETEIGDLVAELTNIIQPKKRKVKITKIPQNKV